MSAAVTKMTSQPASRSRLSRSRSLRELPVLGVPQAVVLERHLPVRPGEVDPGDEAAAVRARGTAPPGAGRPLRPISNRSRVSWGDSASPSASAQAVAGPRGAGAGEPTPASARIGSRSTTAGGDRVGRRRRPHRRAGRIPASRTAVASGLVDRTPAPRRSHVLVGQRGSGAPADPRSGRRAGPAEPSARRRPPGRRGPHPRAPPRSRPVTTAPGTASAAGGPCPQRVGHRDVDVDVDVGEEAPPRGTAQLVRGQEAASAPPSCRGTPCRAAARGRPVGEAPGNGA